MDREVAMLVGIFCAAHINAHGNTPSDGKLESFFVLAERVCEMSEKRADARQAQRFNPDGTRKRPPVTSAPSTGGDPQSEAGHG